MVSACTNSPKTECGCLQARKLETVMYVFPSRRKGNAACERANKTCDIYAPKLLIRTFCLFPHLSDREHKKLCSHHDFTSNTRWKKCKMSLIQSASDFRVCRHDLCNKKRRIFDNVTDSRFLLPLVWKGNVDSNANNILPALCSVWDTMLEYPIKQFLPFYPAAILSDDLFLSGLVIYLECWKQ